MKNNKKNPPTSEAQAVVQIICKCPSCGERINLVDVIKQNGDDEVEIDCPRCGILFLVTRINY